MKIIHQRISIYNEVVENG